MIGTSDRPNIIFWKLQKLSNKAFVLSSIQFNLFVFVCSTARKSLARFSSLETSYFQDVRNGPWIVLGVNQQNPSIDCCITVLNEKAFPLSSIVKGVAYLNWTMLINIWNLEQVDNIILNFHCARFMNFCINENPWVSNSRYRWRLFDHRLQVVCPIQSTESTSWSTSNDDIGSIWNRVFLLEPFEMSPGYVCASEIKLSVFVFERGFSRSLVDGAIAVAKDDFSPVGELVFGGIDR